MCWNMISLVEKVLVSICEIPITFPQAALGSEIEIPTLDGKVKMKIPSGTQGGRVFRLEGERASPTGLLWPGRSARTGLY